MNWRHTRLARSRGLEARPDERDDIPVAACCACGQTRRLPHLIMLHRRSPSPGHGWGCLLCGLAWDGAMAAVCEVCLPPDAQPGDPMPTLRFVCLGYVSEPDRVPLAELDDAPFDHDQSRHLLMPSRGDQ